MYTAEEARQTMKKSIWTWADKWQYRKIVKKIQKAASNNEDHIFYNSCVLRKRVEQKLLKDGYQILDDGLDLDLIISWKLH